MMTVINRRSTAVWVVLMAATVGVTWILTLFGLPAQVAAATILAVAAVKAGLVAFEFIELKRAPRLLQLIAIGWIIGVTAMILIFHLATP